jgi:chromosome segregation ATPase
VKEAIVEFKRKAFAAFQEFTAIVESVNKLKNYEKHIARIQQETMAGKNQWKNVKNSIKKVSLDIMGKNSRKKELESEIATLREQLTTKEKDLEQLVLNLKNQETKHSTYSSSYASLIEHARALSEEADSLLAASSEIKYDAEAAEVEQSRLKWTWSIELTGQLNKMKKNILGFYE